MPPIGSIDDTPGEYINFVQELEHSSALLQSGGTPKERMALVIIDSLAERLLYQHAQRCFGASEAPVARFTRPFPATRRREILDDFNAKVRLALVNERFFVFIEPLLNDLDAEIFRVAHRYRNAGYHRGEHNPALIGPLGRLFGQAVGRAFTRSASHSFVSFSPDEVEELDRFGWREAGELGALVPRSATEAITRTITAPLDVQLRTLADQLATDSEDRLREVETTIESLRVDLDDAHIAHLLESAQHWAQHRGDEQLHQLALEQDALTFEAEESDEVGDELREAFLQNAEKQRSRMNELAATSNIRVRLESIEMLGRRTDPLRRKDRVAPLLQAYRQLDEQLELLERAVEWVARSWDQTVQRASDQARGK